MCVDGGPSAHTALLGPRRASVRDNPPMAPTRTDDPVLRRAQRVLSMVGELHKRGFQRLRIAPGLSPAGSAWRCHITTVDNVAQGQGALMKKLDEHYVATYSSAQGNGYFGWSDASYASARELANLFADRCPQIMERGRGRDWQYSGWYVEMLGTAEAGFVPYAYHSDPPCLTMADGWTALPTTSIWGEGPIIALPPAP